MELIIEKINERLETEEDLASRLDLIILKCKLMGL
jgi:hypothetical protein